MSHSDYDVIIVGARCAGATLAIYLARSGLSVLMIDKDKLPSDQVLSTHTIHPPGIDILDEVGGHGSQRRFSGNPRRSLKQERSCGRSPISR